MGWAVWDLLTPLFDFLKCLVLFAVGLMKYALVGLVNLLIAGLMGLVSIATGWLPDVTMPQLLSVPFIAELNWLLPMDQLVTATVVVVAVLGAWMVLQIPLRWAKVVE